jgi:hypothetical protein
MDFIPYKDLWYWCKHLNLTQAFASRDEMYDTQQAVAEASEDPFTYRQTILEREWIAASRPYYQVFPAVLPTLLKLRLDLPCAALRLPQYKAIELRLPHLNAECPFSWTTAEGVQHRVENVLFGIQDIPRQDFDSELIPGIILCFDIGERDATVGAPIYSFRFFPLRQDLTIEAAAQIPSMHPSWAKGVLVPETVMTNLIKLASCILLLDNDPEIICPDVLSKDALEWDSASEHDRAIMAERAKARGKVGWNIGAAIEVMPHLRRPHPALVWTGQGRAIPKIVLRRGSLVHRNKLSSVPTGFVDQQ